jgi:uncharacterized repeat protein (TIGR02543 family)
MKKAAFLGLLVIILVFGLAGCDSDTPSGDNEYTITFDLDGGNIDSNTASISITVKSGETIETLPEPLKTEYTFGGWFSQKDGFGNSFTTTTKVTSNLTVYADWLYFGPKSITFIGLDEYDGNLLDFVAIIDDGENNTIAEYNSSGFQQITSGKDTIDLWIYVDGRPTTEWIGDGDYFIVIGIYPPGLGSPLMWGISKSKITIYKKKITVINFGDYWE